jgi:uncharacterized membrane protein
MQQVSSPVVGNQMAMRTRDSLSTRLIIAADRAIYRFAHRWLLAFNGLSAGYAGAVVLAPILAATDHIRSADAIYSFFGLFFHQNPNRSFHLFGYKFACCERCAAIYFSIAIFGLLFALMRTQLRRPRYVEIVALSAPVVLDGLAVGSGLYAGNAVVRVITGALFGFAMIWLLYPRFENGFTGIRLRLESLFERLVAQGRTRPLDA